jgi:hypothetical protein
MKTLSLLTAAALFSGIAVANAAEPVTLSDTQLDNVTAGQADATVSGTATAAGFTSSAISITGSGNTTAAPGAYTADGSLDITSSSS